MPFHGTGYDSFVLATGSELLGINQGIVNLAQALPRDNDLGLQRVHAIIDGMPKAMDADDPPTRGKRAKDFRQIALVYGNIKGPAPVEWDDVFGTGEEGEDADEHQLVHR